MKAKPANHHPGNVVFELAPRDEALMEAASAQPRPSPFKITKILVPLDFSDCARKALQYAIPLAREHQADLSLLCVVPNSYAVGEYGGVDYAALQAGMEGSTARELAKLAIEEVPADLPTKTLVRCGSPGAEIVAAAKKESLDLIVISTHGRTGLKHVLLGSVAEYVVRHAPCPGLVAP